MDSRNRIAGVVLQLVLAAVLSPIILVGVVVWLVCQAVTTDIIEG